MNSYACISRNTISLDGNRISGYLSFGSVIPDTLDAKVWLVQLRASDSNLIAIDSTTTCLNGGLPYYEFIDKPGGNYMVKAKLLHGNSVGSLGYVPTYSLSTLRWDSAMNAIHLSSHDTLHINMIRGIMPSGPGFVPGSVHSGAGRGEVTSINQSIIAIPIHVYPNPSEGILNIEWDYISTSGMTIAIKDMEGREYYRLTDVYSRPGKLQQIDISNLVNGLYIVEINYDGGRIVSKIILNK